ncbi:glycosyltransferase [Nocardioides lacusdianchii]|uniref:glycosyltransferase n=1 Tax=Nocardioides lacusdianchii TaxID=2783664 RepID=UPI001CCBF053|nr:glycosyltransferase [Nocardioides lacusdianchii]
MTTLLCVAPYVPWSGIDHAGGSYIYHYLHEFSRLGWEVSLAAPRNADNERARDELSLSDPDIAVTLHDVPARSKLATRLVMLLSGRDGVSPRRWTDAASLAAVASEADVIDLQWHDIYGYAGWFAEVAPGTPIVALAHDLRSQSVRRNAEAARGAKRWSLRLALPRVIARERKELAHCARLLAFKASDLDTARKLGVTAPGVVAPPYVDLVQEDLQPDPTSRTMVFSAAFFRSENSEAAHWFLDEVWPLVRDAVPDAHVRFAGARPPEDLLARASDDVSFTGYLPSILDGYCDALLAVAPLLRGAGLKFKVVQSMALGFPTVGTSVAMEGLEDFLPDTSLPSYDDAAGFAARVVAILGDPPAALDEAALTGEQVRAQLDFSAAMESLSTEYLEIVDAM